MRMCMFLDLCVCECLRVCVRVCAGQKKIYEGVSLAHEANVPIKSLAKGPNAGLVHGPNKQLLLLVPYT